MSSVGATAPGILVMAMTFCAAGQSGAYNQMYTQSYLNGRGWATLGENERIAYVVGLRDGKCSATNGCDGGVRVTPKEIADQITAVYQDQRDLIVPVFEVYSVVKRQIAGASDNEIEQALLELRKKYR
jgi:hypothetical protein